MSNWNPSDEPTLPAEQLPYYQVPNNPGSARKPYQHPGANTPMRSAYPQPQPSRGQGYPQHQGQYGQRARQDYPQQPYADYQNVQLRQQPLHLAGPSATPQSRQQGPRRERKRRLGCLSALVIIVILGIVLFSVAQKVLAFGSAISNQSPLSSQTGYMGGSSRVNILLMGYGGAGHDGAYLTDSLVIMSLLPQSHHTTLISVPRDLWVQNPAGSGNYSKINAVYPTAAGDQNTNPLAGGNAVAQKVSLVTGLQVNYWMTINFAGFKNFIDAIGGIDVNVPDAFTARYPANDDPAVNPNWLTVKFTPGVQHMDGARAIVFARARYVIDNPAEGSDFARSQRQQLIMKAALAKIKNWQTWPHLYGALDTLKQTLYSNLSLADLGEFALKMDLNDAHRVGLNNDNVLVDATSSDGQSILLPRNNDWNLLPPYIQQQLYN